MLVPDSARHDADGANDHQATIPEFATANDHEHGNHRIAMEFGAFEITKLRGLLNHNSFQSEQEKGGAFLSCNFSRNTMQTAAQAKAQATAQPEAQPTN